MILPALPSPHSSHHPHSESSNANATTVSANNPVHWVSWPGVVVEDASQDGVRKKLEAEFNTTPVFLPHETANLFYNKFCGLTLWQLLHSMPPEVDVQMLDAFQENYEAYATANQRYYELAVELYEEGDLVVVFDFHLMLLPAGRRRSWECW